MRRNLEAWLLMVGYPGQWGRHLRHGQRAAQDGALVALVPCLSGIGSTWEGSFQPVAKTTLSPSSWKSRHMNNRFRHYSNAVMVSIAIHGIGNRPSGAGVNGPCNSVPLPGGTLEGPGSLPVTGCYAPKAGQQNPKHQCADESAMKGAELMELLRTDRESRHRRCKPHRPENGAHWCRECSLRACFQFVVHGTRFLKCAGEFVAIPARMHE